MGKTTTCETGFIDWFASFFSLRFFPIFFLVNKTKKKKTYLDLEAIRDPPVFIFKENPNSQMGIHDQTVVFHLITKRPVFGLVFFLSNLASGTVFLQFDSTFFNGVLSAFLGSSFILMRGFSSVFEKNDPIFSKVAEKEMTPH